MREGAPGRQKRERRHRKRSRGREGRSEPARWLTPEERAYHEARRRAERKLKFFQHLICYGFVVGLLALTVRPLAVIVALGWGIGLASHAFQALLAPDLRRRWIQEEVRRQVRKTVTRERRSLEGEQIRSLEELSASIAHEIRNPITAAKSLVQQMGEDPGATENVEYAKVALDELDRVESSISHLLRYAREEELRVRGMRMSEVIDGALETFRDRLAREGVEIRRDMDSDGEMEGDPEKLRRVIINLVGNALDALEDSKVDGRVIEIGLGENLAGNEVWVRVRDNGPGIAEDVQRKMFRPFFTSKTNGTGLGLAISRKLVDAHGGAIQVHSRPGEGTEFTLTFPRAAAAAGAP
jgi:signal transduction histidine kinase